MAIEKKSVYTSFANTPSLDVVLTKAAIKAGKHKSVFIYEALLELFGKTAKKIK